MVGETDATVAQLMDGNAEVADWDLSTRKANEYYIQRMIKPALRHLQVRKIRGPLLDLLYAQLRRCGDHACTGKPFTEHRNAPVLTIDPASGQPAWQQVVNAIGDAIRCGVFPPGEPLPSVREMSTLRRGGPDLPPSRERDRRDLDLATVPLVLVTGPQGAACPGSCLGLRCARPDSDHGRHRVAERRLATGIALYEVAMIVSRGT